MKMAVAFLDLLGFREFASDYPGDTAWLVSSYRTILESQMISDGMRKRRNLKTSAQLEKENHRCGIDSFEHFIPFSDSLFIASSKPSLFIFQVSHFLSACTSLYSHAHACPEDTANPTQVTIKDYDFGRGTKSESTQHWLPVLFRGGLAYGEFTAYGTSAIICGKREKTFNAFGEGIIKAVALEEYGKGKSIGPRIFCSDELTKKVSGDAKVLLAPCEVKNACELMWPLSKFMIANPPVSELQHIHDLLIGGINLWRFFKGKKGEGHYYNYVRLLLRSAKSHCERHGVWKEGRAHLIAFLKQNYGEDLLDIVLT